MRNRTEGRKDGRTVGVTVLLLLCATQLRAQILDSIPAASDTIPPQDTVDETGRFLKAQEQALVQVPVLPYVGTSGPRAALSRIVLNRDSIDWAINESLGDLLMRVPGVYLWRGGWIGRPEYP
ncbi:MAG: hypothetical protein ABI836_09075, partial [Gemmatimonadota bacterium]